MLTHNVQHHILDRIIDLECKFNGILHCDKKTFVSFSNIFNHKLDITRKAIIEQIYILNKLYDKLIGESKKQFDSNIESFVKITTLNKRSNDFYRTILNNEYKHLIHNINTFYNLEKVVKQNLQNYNKALNEYKYYLDKNIMNYNLDNDTINKIVPKTTAISQPIPSVEYCKTDIDRKISYINKLYKETTQTTQNQQKGDYYGI